MTRSLVGCFGVLLFSLGLACDDPAHDLSEWTPADHTHQTEKAAKAAQAQQRRQGPLGKPATYTPPSKRGGTLLVDVTWVKQCANCHGKRGRGDGPQSPMVKAKDLTDAAWQATVTDAQLVEAIKKGKGKMPAFNLPDSMVTELVAKIREMPTKNQKGFPKGESDAPAPAAGAAPHPAAPAAGASAPAPSAAPPPARAQAPAASEEDEDETEGESSNAH